MADWLQFDGDGGDGTAAPVFGTGIEIWVDPDAFDTVGKPTALSRGKLPIKFGTSTVSVGIEGFDITPYVLKDANGIPTRGPHEIVMVSTETTAPNAEGKTNVRVSVVKVTRS